MNFVLNLVLVLQIVSALAMIGLILMQHGKGADMGAAFGSGSSGSLFGASGSANFLSRATAVLATVFFACTLALAYFGFSIRSSEPSGGSVLERAAVTAPAAAASKSPEASAAGPAAGIPTAVPAAASNSAVVPATPAVPASGAAQIPTR
ncbi:MAG: preprotein translocase subunit SecG [Burkholderiaceae bacterium]|uniref:preprotein translocase subunit SecG n=1 Tax=Ottowia sp. TaxID=1898956 RepID=UPI0025DE73F2|nr:preprotein translocase subunit SecG [Ottowia sp.]